LRWIIVGVLGFVLGAEAAHLAAARQPHLAPIHQALFAGYDDATHR
jgi:hypothetical protein